MVLAGTVLALVLLSASSAPAAAPRLLTTSELRTLFVGSLVSRADLPKEQSAADQPEQFNPGGTWMLHADNYEERGSYLFRNNLVCVRAEQGAEVCRFVIRDPDGKYWIVRTLNPPDYKNVRFSKAPK